MTTFDTYSNDPRDWVESYYGEVLGGTADLKTNACCPDARPAPWLAAMLARVHDDVTARFYGCGFPFPGAVDGATVLDLGCGTGRDVYVLSQMVGPTGTVHGVDMTASQLAVAERHRQWHAERFGHARSNVRLHRGYIEELSRLELAESSVDVIVSNCVINLSPRKDLVLAEAHRLLREGGELYISDILADRRLPALLARDPVLYAECLGGAMYEGDFYDLARATGFLDPRVVERRALDITNDDVRRRVGAARFFSVTTRLFKLGALEPRCEDYGQIATYDGSIAEAPAQFVLDDHHVFEAGRPERVCGNTADMLQNTRFGRAFAVSGDKSRHFGEFPCGPTLAAAEREPGSSTGACC